MNPASFMTQYEANVYRSRLSVDMRCGDTKDFCPWETRVDIASVPDFSRDKLPRGKFSCWSCDSLREQKVRP